jgi:hypothetical protein
MKKICCLLVVLLAMSIQLVRSAETPNLIERPASGNGPTQVSVGMWVVDISNIDSVQQNFTAEIAVVLRWKDSRLAHTGNGVVRYSLDQIWHPRVVIVNETNSVSHKFPDMAEVEPDGTVNYRQRYAGAFTQPLRLRSFPLDRQTFHIQLVAVRYRPNEVTFVPDEDWIPQRPATSRRNCAINHSSGLDSGEMGNKAVYIPARARPGVFELRL